MGYGDSLLVTGQARVLQQTDPRKCRLTYQGLPRRLPSDTVFENNPRIAGHNEPGDFQTLPARDMANMRPYHTAKTAERWSYNLAFRPQVGELYFSKDETMLGAQFSPEIVVEPNIKASASPNKRWPWGRWQAFADMAIRAGYALAQIGPAGTRMLDGARLIQTHTFRNACAVLARARAYVGVEGGLHHAAAALSVPGVVIFGGFTPVELTGYPLHRNLGVSLGDACGMRVPCKHCEKVMAAISPEQVLQNLSEVVADGRYANVV